MTISSFEDLGVRLKLSSVVSGRNCQNLGSWATNKKSKDTFLSQTLKVEE